ncbi:MAG: hypothetical protein OXI22_06660 [Defluviicoccus sp.]|nr:hypothetical protein [Defluviicoccus sp.]
MQNQIDFDFDQIRFDSDSMQVVSMSRRNKSLELPLTQGPVNFSVARSDGKFSNRWGVDVGGKGDAYVYCRDNPNAEKVSLHASGQQHISIRSEVAKSAGVKSRFGNVWSEPEFDGDAIATFSLLFPTWGVGLDLADSPRQIKKDELLIVGHKDKLVVVAFFIVGAGRKMQGRVPHIVLGRLPLGDEKSLHVIAWKEFEGDLRDKIERVFPQASQDLSGFGLGSGEYNLCIQGYRQPNSAYMVVVPVRYTSPESEQIIKDTSVRRRKAMQALADR